MSAPFMSSEEYDERAHTLYNDARYDEALAVLREGLTLYPHAVELHIGVGYARLAREEFAWARRSFEESLVLDGDHEDALAGYGETLLRFGQTADALRAFRRVPLDAQKTSHVLVELEIRELAHYDVKAKRDVVDPGRYELLVGSSSADIRLQAPFDVAVPR